MAEIQRGTGQTQTQTAEIPPEYVQPFSSSVGTDKATITFSSRTSSIIIENTHGSQTLTAFFRSSEGTFASVGKTIAAGGLFSLDIRTDAIQLKGSGASTTYEVLALLE